MKRMRLENGVTADGEGIGIIELMAAPEWVYDHIDNIEIGTLRKIIGGEGY
jgi:hypothetical protein